MKIDCYKILESTMHLQKYIFENSSFFVIFVKSFENYPLCNVEHEMVSLNISLLLYVNPIT